MHVRSATTLALVAALALSACGQATGGGDSSVSSTASAKGAITGVVVESNSERAEGGKTLPGIKVGLYLQPVHAGGPIAADPPAPIRVVTTDAQGRFRFAGLRPGKRYFIFAVGAHGMTVGHWMTPGGSVKLVACRTCAMPL